MVYETRLMQIQINDLRFADQRFMVEILFEHF